MFISLRKMAFTVSFVLLSLTANATIIETTLELNPEYNGATPNFDTIVLNWSTQLSSGSVTSIDLHNWSMSLFSNGTKVYQDNIITNSMVNSIGGVARTPNDPIFEFDLDTMTLINFDNFLLAWQVLAINGVQFNAFFNDPLTIGIYQISDEVATIQFTSFTQSSTVPEPATLAIFGLGLLGIFIGRKRRSQ